MAKHKFGSHSLSAFGYSNNFEVKFLSNELIVVLLEGQTPKVVNEVDPGSQIVDPPALCTNQLLQLLPLVTEDQLFLITTLQAAPIIFIRPKDNDLRG